LYLLGVTPPQSLMAATQTHEVYSCFTDVQSYKLNDELIYTSLYIPLHENPKVYDVTYGTQYVRNMRSDFNKNEVNRVQVIECLRTDIFF
jgi:hypothetical protein